MATGSSISSRVGRNGAARHVATAGNARALVLAGADENGALDSPRERDQRVSRGKPSAAICSGRPWPRVASSCSMTRWCASGSRDFSDGTTAVDLDPLSLLCRLAA
jgi:hypothetical protein